ncbi:MAG: hypothetical protein AB8B71_16550 [Paracoccaceae bacterium]
MLRLTLVGCLSVGLAACEDGRGTQYSSARAQQTVPDYIPVTPGAVPVRQPVLTAPISVTPGAVPIVSASSVQVKPVSDNALPASSRDLLTLDPHKTAFAPVASLKPPAPSETGTSMRSPQTPVAAAAPTSSPATPARRYAKGTLHTACQAAGRKEATDRRCGCVQWVANRELTPAQQKRGAGYFTNQQALQDARQSDSRANEQFWAAWKEFGSKAGRLCRST